jgi:heat shock protein HslJ
MIILVAADTPPTGPTASGTDFREAIRSTSFSVTALYSGPDKIGIEKGKVSIRLDDLKSSITGKGPCNNYFGTAKMEFTAPNRGTIRMGGIGSTMMACDPEIMDQEKLFIQLLQQADHFEYQDGVLTFRAGEKLLIEMQSQTAPAQQGK